MGGGTATITLGAAETLSSLTFSPGAGGSYVLSGSGADSLQLANGGNSASISVVSGSDAINAPVVLDNNLNVTAASGTSLTISGAISQSGGSRGLTLSGGGSLTLSGSDSYTGGTTISGGTLTVATPAALPGSGLVTIGSGGRLVLGNGSGIGSVLAASRAGRCQRCDDGRRWRAAAKRCSGGPLPQRRPRRNGNIPARSRFATSDRFARRCF